MISAKRLHNEVFVRKPYSMGGLVIIVSKHSCCPQEHPSFYQGKAQFSECQDNAFRPLEQCFRTARAMLSDCQSNAFGVQEQCLRHARGMSLRSECIVLVDTPLFFCGILSISLTFTMISFSGQRQESYQIFLYIFSFPICPVLDILCKRLRS